MISDAHWIYLRNNGPHRVFARALGNTEASFYWESEFSGTADIVNTTTLRLAPSLLCPDPAVDAERFHSIWLVLKRHFPLLASSIDSCDGKLHFVVSEARMLNILSTDEFEFLAHADAAAAESVVARGLNSPVRRLSARMPAALSVLRREDQPEGTYELITVTAHMIGDGTSLLALSRTLCDILARWPASLEVPVPALEVALAAIPSLESMGPTQSLARQRWRQAAARIINARRAEQHIGGQTLPRTFSALTAYTPSLSRGLYAWLSPEISRAAVAACRAHRVTVGHTLPVLGQVALSRMLHRRLARGDLALDEWESRKRGPMMSGGPANLRPLFDSASPTLETFSTMNVCTGFFADTLPSIPRAPLRDLEDPTSFSVDSTGAPALHALLSRERFWLRASMCKRTPSLYQRHPLYLELSVDMAAERAARAQFVTEAWKRMRAGEDISIPPLSADTHILTHGGSSIGNTDYFLPCEYPLHKRSSSIPHEITLRRLDTRMYPKCRPAQLYLGSNMGSGIISYFIFYDANVYEDRIVEEWHAEIQAAATYFLGGMELAGQQMQEFEKARL